MRFLIVASLLIPPVASHAQSAPPSGTIPFTTTALGVAQSGAAVFAGIPFPPATLFDAAQLDLRFGTMSVPRSTSVLSTYPDGSLRVVRIGFTVTLTATETRSYTLRYNLGAGTPAMLAWTRNQNVLAMCAPAWYGASSVFNGRFLASADNTLFPAFETRMLSNYNAEANPPSSTNPDNRNYYDHVHALYMTLLRNGGPTSCVARIWNEAYQFRENEILHSGPWVGQYNAGSITSHASPIPFNVIRRMFITGLLEDWYFTGDQRSFDVAQEMANAYRTDAYLSQPRFTWTERIPGWEILGLCAMYEATLDSTYLAAAQSIASVELAHQSAMATKYPNQGGVPGQTGAFVQDRFDAWFDPSESTMSGCGSSFMTTVLCEGLIKLYWLTGNTGIRDSVLWACDWLVDAAYYAPGASFWYVAVDTATGTTPSLNPMWLNMLGFAHQLTGEAKYLATANAILAANDWGNTIKEFNQGMRTCGQGLYLLQAAPGTRPLVWNATSGGGTVPPPPPFGGGGGGGGGGGCGLVGAEAIILFALLRVLASPRSATRSAPRDQSE